MGLKSIFDALYVDQLIQKNERGEAVVYPYGLAGRGYLLAADRIGEVRTKMRRLMLLAIATGFAGACFLIPILASGGHGPAWMWACASGAILAFVAVCWMQMRIAAGLKQSPVQQRPSIGVFMRNARMARPLWSLWAEVVLGAIVLVPSTRDLLGALNVADYAGIAQNAAMMLLGAWLLWDGSVGVLQRRAARATTA